MLDNDAELAGSIGAHVKFLQKAQDNRIRQCILGARLYGNSSLLGVGGMSMVQMMSQSGAAMKERITDNVIQSVIDTATARVGENKPRPYFLTDGGDYKLQRRAKDLNRFVEGVFYEGKAYDKGSDSQRDSEIFGDGMILVEEDQNKRVSYRRVLSAELLVDETEAVYGRPRQLHYPHAVDRDELCARFPKMATEIMRQPKAPLYDYSAGQTASDMVLIVESWHLPSGPKAKDGAHCVTMDGAVLKPLTEWKHDFFPFARWSWSPRPMGYWSQGLAEQLQNKQLEINKILWLIQRSFHMAGTYKVLIEAGSKIVKEHINNEIATLIEYKGTPPSWFVPQVVPPEYYSHLQTIIMSMYERAGISLQSATGQKPAGLNSGEAQRVYRDTVNERLKTNERLNEKGYMQLAEISIALAQDIARRDGKYEVQTPNRNSLKSISMSADELDDKAWRMQCFPTSSLPKDPAGRLQTIQEYIQAGFMTPRQGRRALDFPDLEAVESLANAEEDLLCEILDAICDDGDMQPPEPTDDIQLAMELVVEYINRGRAQKLEEDRLDMLRTWKMQVEALQAAAMPPPVPGAAPGPQAVPAPPPVSQLMPNTPAAAAA